MKIYFGTVWKNNCDIILLPDQKLEIFGTCAMRNSRQHTGAELAHDQRTVALECLRKAYQHVQFRALGVDLNKVDPSTFRKKRVKRKAGNRAGGEDRFHAIGEI